VRASRILIVDDQPMFREVARTLLASRGYAVVGEAGCGREALEAASRLAPDGILLDLCLGPESGLDVAQALTRAQPSVAVVLVSADPPDATAQRLSACGARAFVLKSELAATDLSGLWS
jgi:DNA-binding NarL/FixJ family response regulator